MVCCFLVVGFGGGPDRICIASVAVRRLAAVADRLCFLFFLACDHKRVTRKVWVSSSV